MKPVERLHSGLVAPRRLHVLARSIEPLLPKNASVLDVGTGDGRLAAEILRHRPDLSWRGLETHVRPDTAIPVEPYDGIRLPARDAAHDVVLLVDVLHHAEDPTALLTEAARVARSWIVLKDHNLDGLLAGPTLRFMDYIGNRRFGVPLPHNYWSRTQWSRAWHTLHLEPESVRERIGLYTPPLSWWFDRRLHFIARLRVPTTP